MADHVVQASQIVFMQGRNILDGVVVVHEAVHQSIYYILKAQYGIYQIETPH
jgi:hypothetical protein